MNTPSSQVNRTLLDVFKEDAKRGGHKDKKSWKSFRDKLRLRRAGSAWTSSVPTPASDIPIRPPLSRNASVRFNSNNGLEELSTTPKDEFAVIHDPNNNDHQDDGSDSSNDGDDKADDAAKQTTAAKPMMSRRISSRFDTYSLSDAPTVEEPSPGNTGAGHPPQNLRPQFSRNNSTRMATGRSFNRCGSSMIKREDSSNGDQDEPVQRRMTVTFLDDRQTMSAREAAAAQEAADAKREGHQGGSDEEEEDEGEAGGGQTARMSLLDLLAETDREMGLEGSRYMVGDDEYEEEDEEMEEEEDQNEEEGKEELNCSMCHVKHRGAASGSCGHAYCRLCAKELCVSRDHCPLCNDYIEEILDVF